MSSENPTPGVDRVVLRTVCGHQFGLRRPSRADIAEIWRRYAQRVASPLLNESDILASYDGADILWEARFQVLLLPRLSRRREEISFGETAPAHWVDTVRDEKGGVVGREIVFDNVPPDEFAAACAAMADIFEDRGKNGSAPASSTGSAGGQTSG